MLNRKFVIFIASLIAFLNGSDDVPSPANKTLYLMEIKDDSIGVSTTGKPENIEFLPGKIVALNVTNEMTTKIWNWQIGKSSDNIVVPKSLFYTHVRITPVLPDHTKEVLGMTDSEHLYFFIELEKNDDGYRLLGEVDMVRVIGEKTRLTKLTLANLSNMHPD